MLRQHLQTLFFALASFLGIVSGIAEAGRMVHVIAAFDTDDKTLGHHAQGDSTNILRMLRAHIPPHSLSISQIAPDDMTPNNILQSIRRADVTPDDALLLLYCGHGSYVDTQGDHVLVLKNSSLKISRQSLMSELQNKGAGLTIFMSNACYDFLRPPILAFEGPGDPNKPRKYPSLSPLFDALFFQHDGTIDVTACAKDEKAYSHRLNLEGTLFFNAFTASSTDLFQRGNVTWSLFVDTVAEKVRAAFQTEVQRSEPIRTSDGKPLRQRTQTVTTLKLDVRRVPSRYEAPPSNPQQVRSVRLGITVADSPNQRGVLIREVEASGPAAAVRDANGRSWKLTPGDYITEINGSPIESTADFIPLVRNSNPVMSFVYFGSDDNKTYFFTASLRNLDGTVPGANPGNPGGGNNQTRFGAYISSQNGRVVVTGTVPGSPATRCDRGDGRSWTLEAGDTITHVNGVRMSSDAEYRRAIADSPRRMTIRVLARDGTTYDFRSELNY